MASEASDYSIFVEVEAMKPPVGNVCTQEAKVTRVIDRKDQCEVSVSGEIGRVFQCESRDDAGPRPRGECQRVGRRAQNLRASSFPHLFSRLLYVHLSRN
jgi:hypothetical protein